jgi:hypothetical protein
VAYPRGKGAINLSANCARAAKRIKATGTGSRYQETEIKTTNKSGEGREKVFAIKHSFKGGWRERRLGLVGLQGCYGFFLLTEGQ